jgi:hypothetical protein
MYASAVSGSDTILVKLGYGNILYFLTQSYSSITGGETVPIDFEGFSIITEEMYNDFMRVRGHMDDIVYKTLSNSPELIESYEDYMGVLDYALYSALGYVDNYFKLAGRIYELNPDANIICIGMYDALDGFVYDDGERKISLESDAIIQICDAYTSYMLNQCKNTGYVNISDVHDIGYEVNVRNLNGSLSLEEALEATSLTGPEHVVVSERVLAMIAQSAEYELVLTVDGIPQTYSYGYGDTVVVTDPVKVGYTFSGWNAAIPETMPACNIQLYGTLDINSYNVVYDANGGNGTMGGTTLTYIQEYALAENGFEKSGFNFKGWNTMADGSGTSYAGGTTVSMLSPVDGATVTLYAQWEPAPQDYTLFIVGGAIAAVLIGIVAVMYFRRS